MTWLEDMPIPFWGDSDSGNEIASFIGIFSLLPSRRRVPQKDVLLHAIPTHYMSKAANCGQLKAYKIINKGCILLQHNKPWLSKLSK